MALSRTDRLCDKISESGTGRDHQLRFYAFGKDEGTHGTSGNDQPWNPKLHASSYEYHCADVHKHYGRKSCNRDHFLDSRYGRYYGKSINAPDYTVTLAALIFYSVVSLVTVLIVDLSYGIVDPRVRMGGRNNGKILLFRCTGISG